MQRMISVIVFCVKNTEKTNTHNIKYWSWKYPRPILQDRDQDQDLASQDQDQDQDHIKVVSSALETETEVSRTTSLLWSLDNFEG